MANIKIAQMTNKTTLADTDTIIVETATATEKMTVGNLKALLGITGGGIAESGSTINGEYVKYADGRLEMWGEFTTATDAAGWITTNWIPFPIHTSFPIFPVASLRDGGGQSWAGSTPYFGANDDTRVFIVVRDCPPNSTQKISWQIKTRWKA